VAGGLCREPRDLAAQRLSGGTFLVLGEDLEPVFTNPSWLATDVGCGVPVVRLPNRV